MMGFEIQRQCSRPCRREPATKGPGTALVIAATLLAPGVAQAQFTPISGTGYARQEVAESYQGCPGTLNKLTEGDGGGVKQTFPVNLPFSFRFYGREETTLSLFSGGAIAFPGGQSLSINNSALGSTSSPNGLVAVFWGDLELLSSNNGFLGTSVSGQSPNRTFCIEWNNFNDEQVNGALLNFKVVLHEGPAGRIDIHYGPATGSTGSYTATMGLEDQSGGRAFDLRTPACSPSCNDPDFRALSGRRITLIAPQRDLVAGEVQPPRFAFIGGRAEARVGVASVNDADLGPFEIALEASDDPRFTGAVPVGNAQFTLAPFETLAAAVPFSVPTSFQPNQRVFLRATVDGPGAIQEVDESNNTAVSSGSILLIPGGPDLVVSAASASTARAVPGEPVTVSARVENLGSQAATFDVSAVLSTNPVISGDDARLADQTLTLAGGEGQTVDLSFTVPTEIRPRRYYLGVVADPDQQVAENEELDNARAAGTLTIENDQVTVITRRLPSAILGEVYTAFINATGGSGQFTFEIVGGELPAGLGLSRSTGELFGRPSALETTQFTVRAVDATDGSRTGEASLELTVVEEPSPLTVVTRSLPSATVGGQYRFQLVAAGGQPEQAENRTWSGIDLPAGFAVTSEGVLEGAATAPGMLPIEVQVTDGIETARRTLELEVVASPTLAIVAKPLPEASLGSPYTFQFEAVGGETPLLWRLADAQDLANTGLDLSEDGELAGTPTEAGRYQIEVRVVDRDGVLDEATFVLTVRPDAQLRFVTESLPAARVGVSYDQGIAATGGVPPYEWSVVDGRVPAGLTAVVASTFNELRIVGVPEESAESSTLLIQAVDEEGRTQVRAFSLQVEPAPEVLDQPEDGGCRASRTGGARTTALVWLGLIGWAATRRRSSTGPR